jgi:hypothetical protein
VKAELMTRAQRFYHDDLAYIHDVGFSGLAEGWAPGLLEMLRQAEVHEGTIIDLGCGTFAGTACRPALQWE